MQAPESACGKSSSRFAGPVSNCAMFLHLQLFLPPYHERCHPPSIPDGSLVPIPKRMSPPCSASRPQKCLAKPERYFGKLRHTFHQDQYQTLLYPQSVKRWTTPRQCPTPEAGDDNRVVSGSSLFQRFIYLSLSDCTWHWSGCNRPPCMFVFSETLVLSQWAGLLLLSGAIFSLAFINLGETELTGEAKRGLLASILLAVGAGIFVALYTTVDALGIRTAFDPFYLFSLVLFFLEDLDFPVVAYSRWKKLENKPEVQPLIVRGVFGALIAFFSFGTLMLCNTNWQGSQKQLADTALRHGYAKHTVMRAIVIGLCVISTNLVFVEAGHFVHKVTEAFNVMIIKRGIDLIKHTNRRRVGQEYRKDKRHCCKSLLAARKKRHGSLSSGLRSAISIVVSRMTLEFFANASFNFYSAFFAAFRRSSERPTFRGHLPRSSID
ncbi:hypothetical protein GQR58_028548 [Nymphon striatum]|nr:hypothetical protein GQR58_028548 [Nymphon striatum]